jgi:hypothetical protein
MTFLLNRIHRLVTEKSINDGMPVGACNSEAGYGVKGVRRPLATALPALPMMSPHEPKETVPAVRARTIGRHSVGGKILIMPPLCRKYRFVKSQRAENWWQILYIPLN